MDLLLNLGLGFSEVLSVNNLLFSLVGVLIGTLVGVLPGIGPLSAMATLMPLTFTMPPIAAIVMLAGIFYGAQYGGSITAILVNMPGEASSAVTTLDGHAMARKGKAGTALATAAIASFIAGTLATIVIAIFATPLAKLAASFGAREYTAVMLLGLVCSIALSNASLVKALGAIIVGLILGLVGTDLYTGAARMTFHTPELMEGISLLALSLAIFGIVEIIHSVDRHAGGDMAPASVTSLLPSRADFRRMIPPSLRGTAIGSLLGTLPGGGALLSSFAAYAIEKKISKNEAAFGTGMIEGVAAPEAANNAGAQTSFIPMLSLGIPSNAVMALMIGALMIHGVTPGPLFIANQPELFWGLVASMWIGNILLLILNLPLVRLWVYLFRVPYHYLFPAIIVFASIGIYGHGHSVFELWELLVFSILGYFVLRIGLEPTPLILGFVLGPMLEEQLRRAMLVGRGDPIYLISSPLSGGLVFLTVLILVAAALPKMTKRRSVLADD